MNLQLSKPRKKRKNTQVNKMRNKRIDIIVDTTEIITVDYYEQFFINKLDNLEEEYKFLDAYNLLSLNHGEKESLNRGVRRFNQ